MARDKGNRGRSKRKTVIDSVMHDRDLSLPESVEVAGVSDGSDDEDEDAEEAANCSTKFNCTDGVPGETGGAVIPETGGAVAETEGAAAKTKGVSRRLPSMTNDQIESNPLVLRLIDHLAALEESLRTKTAEVTALIAKKPYGTEIDSDVEATTDELQIPDVESVVARPADPTSSAKEVTEGKGVQGDDVVALEGPANLPQMQSEGIHVHKNDVNPVEGSDAPEAEPAVRG